MLERISRENACFRYLGNNQKTVAKHIETGHGFDSDARLTAAMAAAEKERAEGENEIFRGSALKMKRK